MKESVGVVETRGLVASIAAADAMTKASKVSIKEFRFVGSGLVAVVVAGEIAAVQAAVDSGRQAADKIAEVVSCNVIANPHKEVEKLMQRGDV